MDKILIYKALVRPSYIFGVAQNVLAYEVFTCFMLFLYTKNFFIALPVLVFVPMHLINMLITKYDYQFYRNMYLSVRIKFKNTNLFKIGSSFYG